LPSKLVLVTGASSGIGEALARRYGTAGAHVLLLARNAERLAQTAEAVRRAGGAASIHQVDLADADAVAETASRIKRESGTPDILINNAGAGRWLPLLDTTPEEARVTMAVPYFAAFDLTRAFLSEMLARGSGAVACVTSPASYLVWPNASAYIAARHALLGFTESLRAEVKAKGIDVTLVLLGTVETPYWENNPGSRERVPVANKWLAPVLSPEEAAEAIFAGLEARRRMVVKPAVLRALFMLHALAPGLVARQLRRSIPKQS
jgi:short-subunit dehydrogenase